MVELIEDRTSYIGALKAIKRDLESDGIPCRINLDHKCVDVLNDDGSVKEQHYPDLVGTKTSKRGKYVKVGKGKGDYILTYTEYPKKIYTNDGHLVKNVSSTGKSFRRRKDGD